MNIKKTNKRFIRHLNDVKKFRHSKITMKTQALKNLKVEKIVYCMEMYRRAIWHLP